MTVCQLYEKTVSQKRNVRHNTQKGQHYLKTILEKDPLGGRSIDSVKLVGRERLGNPHEREGICLQDDQQL